MWLAAAYWTSQYIAVLPFGFVVISVFIFAVPIAISGLYSSAINQTRMMSYYKTSGWIFIIFSGRLIRSILWIIWALTSSFVMLLQFSTYSGLDWVTLGFAIPVFWYIHKLCNKVFSRELKKRYVISSFTITWTRLLCPLLLVVLYAVLVSFISIGQNYTSLADAVAAARANTPEVTGSSVVQFALFFISFADGTKEYLGSTLSHFGEYVPLLLIILGSYMAFFNASVTFSSFTIPRTERRRIFGPISDEETPPSLTLARVAIAAAVVTVVTLFIYVPLFAEIEDGVRRNPGLIASLKNAQRKVEKIDDLIYRPGTLKAIELRKSVALETLASPDVILEGQIDRAFDQIESNVDGYLDWYYTLPAEYMRLFKLMTGGIEKYMEEKLVEKLKQNAFKPVIAGLEDFSTNYKTVNDSYQQDVKDILAKNRLEVPEFGANGIPGITSNSILFLPTHFDVISMRSRVIGGAAAASFGVAIGAKIASKGIFKAAGKALSKIAISKAAGTTGGATIGAVLGSVVLGVGTVIGGVIGGAIAGVLADKVLLKLEEAVNREDFKKEIVGAIRESRDEFKSKPKGAPE